MVELKEAAEALCKDLNQALSPRTEWEVAVMTMSVAQFKACVPAPKDKQEDLLPIIFDVMSETGVTVGDQFHWPHKNGTLRCQPSDGGEATQLTLTLSKKDIHILHEQAPFWQAQFRKHLPSSSPQTPIHVPSSIFKKPYNLIF